MTDSVYRVIASGPARTRLSFTSAEWWRLAGLYGFIAILHLAGWELIKMDTRILWPIRTPLIEPLFNRWLAPLLHVERPQVHPVLATRHGVIVALALNWFGDSLDGTVARVRNQQRPRYGFYVDHIIDLAGTTMLVAGMAGSGLMQPLVAGAVLHRLLQRPERRAFLPHASGHPGGPHYAKGGRPQPASLCCSKRDLLKALVRMSRRATSRACS